MTNALEIEDVVKRFGNHVAVDGISFTVPRGVVYGVLGPNGAGKSTTLRMINDVVAPDSGRIQVLGLAPGAAAARQIGYLPEERGLYPKMFVAEMVQFMGELRGLSRAEAARRAARWLERLGLTRWAKNRVQDLSKGMQQKVQFATALIHDPELLILDEPWSGLDPINAEVLRSVVEEARAAGRTVLFSTHLMEQAEKVCDAVCIIARGKKVLDGNLAELRRAAAAHGRIALGFEDAAAKAKAQAGPLADPEIVAAVRAPAAADSQELVVELRSGVTSDALLAALLAAGGGLRRFEAVTPTLHQIFVARADPSPPERRDEGRHGPGATGLARGRAPRAA
ncbi:MAG TPA: ATP-binding cassette domain-containing protein, partial [Kofleriaceae bacterium]|nr:ATP-binding cassette domain-containing protein [Kofleriaceae bacterium]